MDYRRFLSGSETLVLPYFGGMRVEAAARRLRVETDAVDGFGPGWWRFAVAGRRARPLEPAAPAELHDRPALRGHVAGGWLFCGGDDFERFALPPEEEPEPLAPCVGRRWHGGDLLLGSVEFEDEAEDQARRALDAGAPLAGVKGVSPSLRAAFGFAVLAAAAAELELPVSPRESGRNVLAIADGGRDAARALLRRLEARRQEQRLAEERRRQERQRRAEAQDRERALVRTARAARPIVRAHGRSRRGVRADEALDAAGARLLRTRTLGADLLEVRFAFMGEQFVAVVDPDTLQVRDAGICLDGADRELTLESLPSAIREAIVTHQLVITRR